MKNCNNQCSCINPNNKPALCECEYLKPLSIDSLFSNNNDYEICDVLDKTKKIRNSFFTIKTAIKKALQMNKPVIIDVVTDIDALAPLAVN